MDTREQFVATLSGGIRRCSRLQNHRNWSMLRKMRV
jgi:hypothetical protein